MSGRDLFLYLGHDANCTIYDPDTREVEFYPLEKFFDVKHIQPTLNNWISAHIPGPKLSFSVEDSTKFLYDKFYKFFEHIGVLDEIFENVYLKRYRNPQTHPGAFHQLHHVINCISMLLTAKKTHIIKGKAPSHHKMHMWYGYHESKFNRALVLTYDGGGDWQVSNLFGVLTGNHGRQYATQFTKNLHNNIVAMYWDISDIMGIFSKRTTSQDYAGKIMGLSAYGKYSDEFLQLYDWYKANSFTFPWNSDDEISPTNDRVMSVWRQTFKNLKPEDIAWATQKIFEITMIKQVEKEIVPRLKEYDNNVVLCGGGALNVLCNEKLREKFPEINFYIPPDPSDGSLSIGLMVDKHRGRPPKVGKYSSLGLLDVEDLDKYIKEYNAQPIRAEDLAKKYLNEGKIIGYLSGNVEVGPRALCHRSILCNPKFPDMKDKLNKKVKHREWYRPFAPVCREDHAEKYFISSRWDNMDTMAYAVRVKEEHKDNLTSVTHVDETARLQIMKRRDEPFVYHCLKFVDGNVLLNTSFNESRKPILNRISTAIKMLKETELDNLVIYDQKRDKHWMFDGNI